MKKYVFLLVIFILSACGSKNAFESAIDPKDGSEAKVAKWKDDGGLNKLNEFYGVKISEVSVSFRNDKIKTVIMYASKSYAPKEVRAALSKVCGGGDSEWKISDDWDRAMGMYETPAISCRYIAMSGDSKWELSYSLKDVNVAIDTQRQQQNMPQPDSLQAAVQIPNLYQFIVNDFANCWINPKYGAQRCDENYLRTLNVNEMILFEQFNHSGDYRFRSILPNSLRIKNQNDPTFLASLEEQERYEIRGSWWIEDGVIVFTLPHQSGCQHKITPIEMPTTNMELKYRESLSGNCSQLVEQSVANLQKTNRVMIKLPK